MHSLRLAEMSVKPRYDGLATAAICITTSSHERPSSSMRTTAPICPCARFNRFVIVATCAWSWSMCDSATAVIVLFLLSIYPRVYAQVHTGLFERSRHDL